MAVKCKIIKGKEVCPKPNLFMKSYLGQGVFSPWSNDAQIVFDLMDTDPLAALKTIMETAIDAMVADGNFAELGQLLVVLDTQPNSLTDWMGNQNALAVATPTFDAFDHWELNGTTQYINTQLSPAANPLVSLNSANCGVWVVSHDTPAGTEMLLGSRTGDDRMSIFSFQVTPDLRVQVNDIVALTDATEGSFASGSLYSCRRDDAGNMELFKNGVQVATDAQASTAVPTDDVYWGARNNGGVADLFFGGKVSLYYAGSGNINTLNLFNVFNTMITDIAALG